MAEGRAIRERRHRLPPEAYLGRKAVAFTACVRDRAAMFDDPGIAEVFVPRLRQATERHGCTVPIACFMPDDLHVLLLGEAETSDTKAAMDRFKALTGWWLYRNRPDLHWQKDYWDHIVRAREGWESQARYIAGNPVRAGLIEDPLE